MHDAPPDMTCWLLSVVAAALTGGTLALCCAWRSCRRSSCRAQRFVSLISHELKTPLTAIRLCADTLQLRSRQTEMQCGYLDTIIGECDRISRLVDNLAAWSSIQRGRRKYRLRPLLLGEVMERAVRAVQYPLAKQGFRLHVTAAEGLPPCEADAEALEQAIVNLVTNAMKYSGEGRDIEVDLLRRCDAAVIRVTDHGLGIAPKEQRRIFRRFYRAPTRQNNYIPGTGLGLSLVADIARGHGGQVRVDSMPGRGSVFSLWLPIPDCERRDRSNRPACKSETNKLHSQCKCPAAA